MSGSQYFQEISVEYLQKLRDEANKNEILLEN
jgi:hypothetical protein